MLGGEGRRLYEAGDPTAEVWVQAARRDFYLVWAGICFCTTAHPACYPTGTEGSFPSVKAAAASR